jgi:hypothetical protein
VQLSHAGSVEPVRRSWHSVARPCSGVVQVQRADGSWPAPLVPVTTGVPGLVVSSTTVLVVAPLVFPSASTLRRLRVTAPSARPVSGWLTVPPAHVAPARRTVSASAPVGRCTTWHSIRSACVSQFHVKLRASPPGAGAPRCGEQLDGRRRRGVDLDAGLVPGSGPVGRGVDQDDAQGVLAVGVGGTE